MFNTKGILLIIMFGFDFKNKQDMTCKKTDFVKIIIKEYIFFVKIIIKQYIFL